MTYSPTQQATTEIAVFIATDVERAISDYAFLTWCVKALSHLWDKDTQKHRENIKRMGLEISRLNQRLKEPQRHDNS